MHKELRLTFLKLLKNIQRMHRLIKITYILNLIHVSLKTLLKMLIFYRIRISYSSFVMLKVWTLVQFGCYKQINNNKQLFDLKHDI